MKTIDVTIKTTKPKEISDITDAVNRALEESEHNNSGFCTLFLLHTTASLTTAYLDPTADLDMTGMFEILTPFTTHPGIYEHKHLPVPIPNHIIASFLGPSLTIPIQNSQLRLGKMQRVVLIEFNGPRDRTVVVGWD